MPGVSDRRRPTSADSTELVSKASLYWSMVYMDCTGWWRSEKAEPLVKLCAGEGTSWCGDMVGIGRWKHDTAAFMLAKRPRKRGFFGEDVIEEARGQARV